MTSNLAWKRHGCYTLGSEQYFNFPLDKALFGCYDDWNSLDHFDPTSDTRRLMSRFFYLRTVYGALQDGFNLVQRGNWTDRIERPGSNGTQTEMGLWSVSRAALAGVQTLNGTFNDQVWLLYTNENATKSWSFNCKESLWISSPFESGEVVRNLLPPYETYSLNESLSSFNNDNQAPFFGCLANVTMDPYGFKVLVPVDQWVATIPTITKFQPGHDFRILSNPNDANSTSIDISLEFNVPMDCDGVTSSVTLNVSSSGQSAVNGGGRVEVSNARCGTVDNPDPAMVVGADVSAWFWNATLVNVPDGVVTITVDHAPAEGGNATTNVRGSLFSLCVQKISKADP
jgi:alpha-1,3-glucan synthase